jgi:hypothetical protein
MKQNELKGFKNPEIFLIIFIFLASAAILYVNPAVAGIYLNSAHGNSSYGVKRITA